MTRIKDAKEQFIAGTWNVNFAKNGDVYAFGKFPAGYASTTNQSMYRISQNGKIYPISLTNIHGKVTAVQENKNGAYLFIEMNTASSTSFCLLENFQTEIPKCKQLNVGGIARGLWNPKSEHELVVMTSTSTLYTLDVWENDHKPKQIKADSDKEAFNELSALFQNKAKDPISYWHLFSLLIVKDGKKIALYRVPPLSKITPLVDKQHFLVQDNSGLAIYERSSRTLTRLMREPNADKKHVTMQAIKL